MYSNINNVNNVTTVPYDSATTISADPHTVMSELRELDANLYSIRKLTFQLEEFVCGKSDQHNVTNNPPANLLGYINSLGISAKESVESLLKVTNIIGVADTAVVDRIN